MKSGFKFFSFFVVSALFLMSLNGTMGCGGGSSGGDGSAGASGEDGGAGTDGSAGSDGSAGAGGTGDTSGGAGSSGNAGSGGGSVGVSATTVSTVSIGQARYDIGSPTLTDIYLSPTGSDTNNGTSASTPLKTVNAIGAKIRELEGVSDPDQIVTLSTTGYRINLASGTYTDEERSHIMDAIHGTAQFPVIIQSTSGNRADAIVQTNLEFENVKYVYLRNFTVSRQGDALHFGHSDHILVRNMVLSGGSYTAAGGEQSEDTLAHDMFKLNQVQHVYLEDSELRGANDNVLDWVAVQTGRIIGNVIHNSHDWCAYVKGGSSYITIENNEIYDCYTGGFTAGQGVGFEYMIAPWLTYDTMDIKIVNNIIHDVHGAGLGVYGGFNTLLAYNTLYNVGDDSTNASRVQAFDFVHSDRTCDGSTDSDVQGHCNGNLSSGGWGQPFATSQSEVQHTPSKNIFVYNNLVYNPASRRTINYVFNVAGPDSTMAANSNIPSPARADENLVIKGNYIYLLSTTGGTPLLFPEDGGCASTNGTCNETVVSANNTINSAIPALQSTDSSNAAFLKPTVGGNVLSATTYTIPSFAWTGFPTLTSPTPEAYRTPPTGTISNTVSVDRAGTTRTGSSVPGAYSTGN